MNNDLAMNKRFLFSVLFIFGMQVCWAINPADSLLQVRTDSTFSLPSTISLTAPLFLEEAPDLLTEGIITPTASNDSIQRYIDLARTLIGKVRETQNFIFNLHEASAFELPVGISKTVGGITYDLAIHAVRMKPAYAELDVFMQFETPQGQTLTFMARNIKLTNKGAIVGDAKLELVGDYGINFNGGKTQLILKGSASRGNTFVTIDCEGFKEIGIDADVKFSRDLIRPENPDGTQGQGNVAASFKTVLSNWNDLVVQISLPAFQVAGLEGVGFTVQDAVFDFSDLRNAPNIQFPKNYQSTQMLPGNPNLWRGFYLRQLVVKLPQEFKAKDNAGRTSFEANNVLIDNMGFTGMLKATKLLSLEKGDMNGWSFSVDSLHVGIQANQLTEAGFAGKIVIPVSDAKTPFEYKAIISSGGNYLFSVSPAKDISFNLWSAAHVDIYQASYIEIKVVNHKFLPKANLHGRMAVQGKLSSGGQGVELANISFENLEIQSVKPYIKVGSFSFGSEAAQQKMAGFPISISNIGMKSISDTEVGLDFNLKLNLVGENNGAFAADAGLTLVGEMNTERGWQSWKYKNILVREIGVDIDGGAFKINGRLIFYRNDVTYGDGFNGTVKAEFTPGIKVSATAIFGNVNNMRYWYADAMVNFPTAIPIFPAVGVYGFGGGAYFAMKMDNTGAGSALGKTASGVIYVPDTKAGLGLKAIVNIGSMPKPEAFNADVTFEISFFKGGGVRYISFGGNGYLATPGLNLNLDKMKGAAGKMVSVVKKAGDKISDATGGLLSGDGNDNSLTQIFGEVGEKSGEQGQISARVMISFDFENKVLHGNFEAYVNVAGGIIKGVGPGGRAGWCVLHFAPGEWYVYVGTPDDRIGISLGIGSIRANATSYFMVGTQIPGSPPPPVEVTRILGGGDYDYMKDLNAIGKGAGFAFGAALNFSTGNLSFLMFYARFDLGAGFDIMLKDYGDAHCKGSSKRIGVNGWYANGQAYAYFDGDIGIRVKVFGRRKSVSILSVGAAALLQTKLPNPFWMRGVVGGRFSVLGGLVKGNCKFTVTLGKECEIVGGSDSVLDDIQVIADVTPASDEADVNVFNTPQAVFNMAINKTFELVDDENQKRSFRIKLDHFKLLVDNKAIVGTIEWNDEKEVASFNSYEILPEKKVIKVAVQVSFEEYSNGAWAPAVENGQIVVEKKEQVFTTGVAPDYIPLSNIEYSYPVIGQVNFYKNETPDGYFKLKKAQPYLFQVGQEWKQVGRFVGEDRSVAEFSFAYTYSTNIVSFKIPSNVKTNLNYTLDFVNTPAQKALAIDRNVSKKETNVMVGNQKSETAVTTKTAEGTIDALQEKSILTTHFRSSKYSTFHEKITAQKIIEVYRLQRIPLKGDYLNAYLGQDEPFDKTELVGNEYSLNKPLVTLEADLKDNAYYWNEVHPLVYANYPIDGDIKVSRDINVLGLPATKAVAVYQEPATFTISNEGQLLPGALSYTSLNYQYDLPYYAIYDFEEIQQKVVNRYLQSKTRSAQATNIILATMVPTIKNGEYKVNVYYQLPGKSKTAKSIVLSFTK
jgi:hypothetical protein